MTAQQRLLHAWTAQVVTLLPAWRVTRARPLALLVAGLLWAGTVSLPRLAAALPLGATDPSTERRLRRWLANPAVDPAALWTALRPALLAGYAGRPLTLVVDLTPHRTTHTLVVVGVVCRRRVLPLALQVMPQQTTWPVGLTALLSALLPAIAAAIPPTCAVTLLADRGITSAGLIDVCTRLGWHWILRVNTGPRQTNRIRQPDGTVGPMWAVVRRVRRGGPGWTGPVALFPGAGWRPGILTVHWGRGTREPWVLVSDAAGGAGAVRTYRQRTRIEATFQDWKERGWRLERSRLTDPVRLARLLVALAIACWWATQLGLRAVRGGFRAVVDRPARPALSLLRLGLRFLTARLADQTAPPLPFAQRHPGHLHFVVLA